MVSVGSNLSVVRGDHELLLHLLNNYRTINHKLLSYIQPKARSAIVKDLSWYLSLRIQNHVILEFEQRAVTPVGQGCLSLTSRLQQLMELPQHRVSFFSEENLRSLLKSTLDDPNPLPYCFPIAHDVIPALLFSFLALGAVHPEEWVDLNEEMVFEMNEIRVFLLNNKALLLPLTQ
jgi:hypothetical protein